MSFIDLPKAKMMRPDDNSEQGIRLLSADEYKVFNQLSQLIETAQTNNKVTIVYRGERKSTLKKKLFQNGEAYEVKKFLNRLFYVGDKAKSFFKQSESQLKSRRYLRSVNDISNETFEFIFCRIHLMITQNSLVVTHKKQEAVKQFKQRHPEFAEFFGKKNNTKKFVNKVRSLSSVHQEVVRDYYLYLLHTDGLGEISFFVSTSINKKTAIRFALDQEKLKRRGIVFYYFVPEPSNQYGVRLLSSKLAQSQCQEIGLPIFTDDLYPKQNELAIKGALFPHFRV